MNIKDLVNAAFEQDASSFEDMFASMMGERVDAAVAAKYDTMFGESVEEDDEDDDEDEDDD